MSEAKAESKWVRTEDNRCYSLCQAVLMHVAPLDKIEPFRVVHNITSSGTVPRRHAGGLWLHLETSKAFAMRQERAQWRIHHAVGDLQSFHAVRPIKGGVHSLQTSRAPQNNDPLHSCTLADISTRKGSFIPWALGDTPRKA